MECRSLQRKISLYFLCLISVVGSIYLFGNLLAGCVTSPPPPPVEVVRPRVIISPRCREIEEEIPQMIAWCNSTMISPSRSRHSCRVVEDYERLCHR
jgi:hypothetical protein